MRALQTQPSAMARLPWRLLAGAAWVGCLALPVASASTLQTVCTITVNSADEKESFQRHLPAGSTQFVELVERGRPDWLASACSSELKCDVLIVSGHYDGVNAFFSDHFDKSEFLSVDELERVACSQSCPGLFSQLKEVHLYGCNTLNSDANSTATVEIVRSLVREGHSPIEAARQLRALNAGHGQSSRDRMRQIFTEVPVIYGFSSVAPLGPLAGAVLSEHFRSKGAYEVGSGRASRSLLEHFAPFAMTVAVGMSEHDPHADVRRDVCRFADDRATDAHKLNFVHQVLQREMAQSRVHLDRIQRFTQTLNAPTRRTPEVELALATISADGASRSRFLAFARDADQPAVRARMLKVALDLGWLTAEQRWLELALMLSEFQARPHIGVTEIDLACSLNQGRDLDGAFPWRSASRHLSDDLSQAALRACLGSAEAQVRLLDALVSPDEPNGQTAQTYLRLRSLTEATDLRHLTGRIAQMKASKAQVRALEVLGRHYVSDREVLERLIELFSATPSPEVQAAIAGILIRADLRALAAVPLARLLRRGRHPALGGDDMINALIRRLDAS